MKIFWIFVGLVFCSLPAYADALGEYQNAVGNDERGEYYTAILNLRRSIAENPAFVPSHLLMGDVLVKLGKFSEADSSYFLAEQSDPESVDAATRRLKLYAIHLQDFAKAEKLLEAAASRFGQSAEIHYYKALVLKGKHNYLNARSELRLALALREKFFDARKLQLEVESIIGDPKMIYEAATLLLDDFPASVESYDFSVGYLLKAKVSVAQVLDLFSKSPPSLLVNPRFGRLMARLALMADRYDEAAAILDPLKTEGLVASEVEDLIYLKSLAEVARGHTSAGIQILADYLKDVPDRPYLVMQLDLWLLRYSAVNDPLRVKRADDRLRIGRMMLSEKRAAAAFIALHLARKLNPRDKDIRRFLAEAAWQMGLAETAREELLIALDLDPRDPGIRQRSKSIGVGELSTDISKKRTYNMYVFRLSDDPTSTRPSLGRLFTDAVALFAVSLTPFNVQALEPAVPFEKAEEVAHQKGADFFFHGQMGLEPGGTFSAEMGIYPVGGRGDMHALEFKEQHVVLKSRSDFTDEIIIDAVQALHRAASQHAKVVKKEREGAMIVDIGRRHGLAGNGRFLSQVVGGPLYSDVVQIYEWFTRIQVQEIERAKFIGIGDFLKQVYP